MRLESRYFDNWQKDVLKALLCHLDGECRSSSLIDKTRSDLLLKQILSEKDNSKLDTLKF